MVVSFTCIKQWSSTSLLPLVFKAFCLTSWKSIFKITQANQMLQQKFDMLAFWVEAQETMLHALSDVRELKNVSFN